MSEKKPNPSEDEQKKDEPTQSKAATAVLEKPKKREFEDHEKVTVLYGWNKVTPGYKQFVDKTPFLDGIARHVPYGVVKHWIQNTRPDGKLDQVYGKIAIQAILPDQVSGNDGKLRDVGEKEFCEATGITPVPVERFASQLAGVDLDALAAQLGAERLTTLIAGLEKHLPAEARRR